MCTKHRLYSGANKGQAIVEFALVLPILLLLSMLIIQYGIIYYTTLTLTNLSREGARYAAVNPGSDSDINSRIRAVLPSGITWSDIGVTIDPAQNSADRVRGSNKLISVTLTYNMQKKLFLPSTFFGVKIFNKTYSTKTTMMVE